MGYANTAREREVAVMGRIGREDDPFEVVPDVEPEPMTEPATVPAAPEPTREPVPA